MKNNQTFEERARELEKEFDEINSLLTGNFMNWEKVSKIKISQKNHSPEQPEEDGGIL